MMMGHQCSTLFFVEWFQVTLPLAVSIHPVGTLVGGFFHLQGGDVQVHQVRATRSPLVETSMSVEQDG